MFKFSKISVLKVVKGGKLPEILDGMLRKAGVERIFSADNLSQMFDIIREEKVDIVLIDDNPPVLDGVNLISEIRLGEDSPDCYLPVILMSRSKSIRRTSKALEAGVHTIMLQPFPASRLLSHITRCITDPPKFVCSDQYFGPDRKSMDKPASPAVAERSMFEEQEGLQEQVDAL